MRRRFSESSSPELTALLSSVALETSVGGSDESTSGDEHAAVATNPSAVSARHDSAGARAPREHRREARSAVNSRAPARGREPAENAPVLQGNVTMHPRGFGFIETDDGKSWYLRASLAKQLLTGDRVEFKPVMPRETTSDADGAGKSDGEKGAQSAHASSTDEVHQVVRFSRSPTFLLCEVRADETGAHSLVADEPCFFPLQLDLTAAEATGNPAPVAGDVVAVRIPAFEGKRLPHPQAVTMLRNLGPRSRDGFDEDYARVRHGFDEPIPTPILMAARAGALSPGDAFDTRADAALSTVPFVTIDGESTRDLDDAVYARRLITGPGWEVQVAIADVSWYVRPGTMLDDWAAKRCTSLYLPTQVVPMLPEQLSTDQCSLRPGQPRRAVIMTVVVDAMGEVQSTRLARGWIESAARLSYTQVASFLAGKDIHQSAPVVSNLQALAEVYAVLAARHDRAGRLEFDEPEPSLTADGGIKWEHRNDAHKLVEELMLLANGAAARCLVNRYGAGLFRQQAAPDAESWKQLRDWVASIAPDSEISRALPETPSMRALADLAEAFEGEQQMAVALRIRTAMQPARYVAGAFAVDAAPVAHFTLSAAWYTHFTSPIRRYADLLVHRLLLAPDNGQPDEASWQALAVQAERCSDRAHAARLAERMVWDRIKQQHFMDEVPAHTQVSARIVRTSRSGVRVVVQGWQCAAWLSAAALREQGLEWHSEQWGPDPKKKASGEQVGVLRVGDAVPVAWHALSFERPAQPDLLVQLMPRTAAHAADAAASSGAAKAPDVHTPEALT